MILLIARELHASMLVVRRKVFAWKGDNVESLQDKLPEETSGMPSAAPIAYTRQTLPPKGTCWYCERPVDSVRRFCGKECHDAFDEEAEFTKEA